MLRNVKGMEGYKIDAKDGTIGHVKEFHFDDQKWTIRYVIVDTGNWLPGRRVHISPAGFYGKPDWESQTFPVVLTKDMVKNCPSVDADKPISRQKEIELARYYNWPLYWEENIATNVMMAQSMTPMESKVEGDQHLRSTKEITGYKIHAKDGEIGHVEDFVVDDESWAIRYMIVNTGNWLPGKKVIITPSCIEKFEWTESTVYVHLTKDEIEHCPPYDPNLPINRDYEESLYDYYGKPKYWG